MESTVDRYISANQYPHNPLCVQESVVEKNERCYDLSLGDDVVNNVGPLWCSVRVVDDMPRAGSHYNLGTSRGPDKIGSRVGPGPRAASCTWLI